MAVGVFKPYDEFLENEGLPSLNGATLTAVLLTSAHTADLAADATYANISADEVDGTGNDYAQIAVPTPVVNDVSGGGAFDSGDLSWGNPVTIPTCRYLAIVKGTPGALNPTDKLVGIMDLDTGASGTVFSTAGNFSIAAPVGGWFDVTRSA